VRESKVTVKIPRPLYRKIQQVVEESGFNSPTDFIVYVLRDLMGEADAAQAAAQAAQAAQAATTQPADQIDQGHEFSQDELDDVKRKLKNLGYL
jgi:Arc/MetJ-type ribon-helix-helix transcriptional regulator